MQQSFDFTRGIELRDSGIKRAAEHADRVIPDWRKRAFDLFRRFISTHHGPFMIEEFRHWCDRMGLPEPPHNRAFGAIAVKARNMGLIRKVGVKKVKNAKAHCANANVWQAYK